MLASLTLGLVILGIGVGGSSTSVVAAGVIRLASLPVLALALHLRLTSPDRRVWDAPSWLMLGAAGLCLAQLLPLPPTLWSQLPGRASVVEGYRLAGLQIPWLPVSLTPNETWSAMLGLLPPAAVLFAVSQLGLRQRTRILAAVVALATLSVALAAAQLAGGEGSPLRFFELTNRDAGVGLFANRNHQAVFLAAALPLLAAVTAEAAPGDRSRRVFWLAVAVGLSLLFAVGMATARSRAGIFLGGVGLLGAFVVARTVADGNSASPRAAYALALALGGAAATALILAFAVEPIAERFEHGVEGELRFDLAPRVAAAGMTFAPVGSGVGSFEPVYRMFETPETLTPLAINHAHNDYLEVWLEAGVPGVALVAGFVGWWLISSVRGARERAPSQARQALAGSLVIGLLLSHSLVDYPLRTPALAMLFALAVGVMLPLRRPELS